jgi:nitrogen regulatory protein P-II 1
LKKIEAIVRPEKVRGILGILKEIGVTGATVVSERGQGTGERPLIRDSKGMPLHTAEYNPMNSVITIVNDSQVNRVLDSIAKVVVSGSRGSGKVFVFPVDEVMDLENGKRSKDVI